MQGSSYIAALAASGLAAALVAAPHDAAAKAHAHRASARSHRSAVATAVNRARPLSLAQMDLTPHDDLVRPYASAYRAGDDHAPLAIDYHFAGDGVMSFGLHPGAVTPSSPILADQSFTSASPTTHKSVGALITYSFR